MALPPWAPKSLCLLGALTTPLDQDEERDRTSNPCDQTDQRQIIHQYLLLLGLDALNSVCNASESRIKYREYLDCTAGDRRRVAE